MNRKDWIGLIKVFFIWLALVCLFGLIFATMWIYTSPALTIFVGGAIVLFLLFHTPRFRRWWSSAEKDWEDALFTDDEDSEEIL